jgi:hypothetical protein
MSTINTGTININYPSPGVNNNSQGFRDNFNSIKSSLDIAAAELTDLQTKALLKSPLTGSTLDNNMNNALISNAQTQGFSRTAKNLGSNLSGTISIDVSKADVQYGTVTGSSLTLSFTKWSSIAGEYPLCSIHLILKLSSNNSVINFPTNFDESKLSLENYVATSSGFSITAPATVTELHYMIFTKNCGETLTIVPVNRSRVASQVTSTVPTSNIGRAGDRSGAIAVDSNHIYVCVEDYNGTTPIWKRSTLNTW